MSNPSLLIVVPTLDSYLLLSRLVASLQEQTWSNWRLLFVDGPSSFEHRSWLIQCCANEPRCRFVSQTSDCPGIFGAMNQGFAEAASDEWVLFGDLTTGQPVLRFFLSWFLPSSVPSPKASYRSFGLLRSLFISNKWFTYSFNEVSTCVFATTLFIPSRSLVRFHPLTKPRYSGQVPDVVWPTMLRVSSSRRISIIFCVSALTQPYGCSLLI